MLNLGINENKATVLGLLNTSRLKLIYLFT